MTEFLSSISLVISAAIEWMSMLLDVVMEEPALLFMCVCIPIVYAVVDLFRRLIRL